jgi:hypothetical protein
VTAVLVVDEVDSVESIIILEMGKRVLDKILLGSKVKIDCKESRSPS